MPEKKSEKRTREELVKENSNYLRGTIKEELSKNTSHFEEADSKLLKFHGIYQQDDRDARQERIAQKLEKDYSFMIRTKLPGGQLTSKQYLGLNAICDKYSNKTLRITTRQTIQFHGVIKGDLHKTLSEINKNLINTYGACGDVVRNVMACPVCDIDSEYSVNLNQLAKEISNHLLPNTRSYYEIWINEEKIDLGEKKEEEPLYGKVYLPRKFKIGLALPQDNCIDLFTQDVGVLAVVEDKKLTGFNILVGGGLGHHHNKPETYPRLASELGLIAPDKLIQTLEKIVKIQRDYGSRENRKHARMKYLIDDKGLDWFKKELEERVETFHGKSLLEPYRKIKSYKTDDHLGWHKQNNNNWYLGLFVENGRICDIGERKIKTGLKEIIEKFNPDIRLTPHQNIILVNIKEENKDKVNAILQKHKIYTKENVSQLRGNSMACPALPTCGLALAEAERVLPNIIDELEKLGFGKETLSLRMSGCPNSCSRPPVGELGIIGMSANKYNIYVGGNFEGTRLNKIYKENINSENIVPEIVNLFKAYRANHKPDEGFGDFCVRSGIEGLKSLIKS
ncbi:MAG: NADPH-dependent assimilatory sulfite reductase hemoprotein subunit [Candidatus Melainabacteria bacterium]|nr:NADPH-dependent assimilatory sulfite reductase hemoprotein subunit [Candidatus Melainabacteria bacterium]